MSDPVHSSPPYPDIARRLAVFALAIFFLLFAVNGLRITWVNLAIGNIWFNDFFAIWSFAKFAITNRAADIYDPLVLHEFQESLGSAPSVHLPCPYPPSFLLLILPLGLMNYYGAYGAWLVVSFLCYFAASRYRGWPRSAPLLLIFAPATILTFVYGQTGFLTSAVIVGGFRLAASRPILSGALFGLVSIKPQLGILIPIALISARLWRTLVVAVVCALALALVSGTAFGWSIWPLWLSLLYLHADWAAAVKPQFMPTIVGNLTFLGVGLPAARMIQLVAAVVVAGIVGACFRRGVTELGFSALLAGTFLATPYAFVYDMPMLTNAIVAVIHQEQRTNRRLPMAQAFILVLSLVLPVLMVESWRFAAIRSIPLVLLFGLIIWHIVRGERYAGKSALAPARKTVSVR